MIINGYKNPAYYPKPSTRKLPERVITAEHVLGKDAWVFANAGAFGIRKNPSMRNHVLETLMATPPTLNPGVVAGLTTPPQAVHTISATKHVRIVSDSAGDFYTQQFETQEGHTVWLNREYVAMILANTPDNLTIVSDNAGRNVYFIHPDYGTIATLCPMQVNY